MKTTLFGALAALFLVCACAGSAPASEEVQLPQPTFSLRLYPQGQGVDAGIVENGTAVTLGPLEDNGLRGPMEIDEQGRHGNVGDDARLDIYLPQNGNGQMIVDVPGGGYRIVSMNNEGVYAAKWCLDHGIACCVVLYRMPNFHHVIPLRDVQNAFRYCRAHAAEWGVKQIGVMGYSAGGHLAASASTLYVDSLTRPDFSVLVYPVINLDSKEITHGGTRRNLTGEDSALCEHYSLEHRVNAQTPPTFLALSADDKVVPPENSLLYFRQLLAHKVPAEMYIYPSGGHGWGFTTSEYGTDKLGASRPDFFSSLEHFLAAQRTRYEK